MKSRAVAAATITAAGVHGCYNYNFGGDNRKYQVVNPTLMIATTVKILDNKLQVITTDDDCT